MNASEAGRQLGKLDWCGVPFCGGCPELPHIRTRGGVASDLHRHVINLARCVRDGYLNAHLKRELESRLFHPDELAMAQIRCRQREAGYQLSPEPNCNPIPDVQWAADYFLSAWMGRGGHSGKKTEFTQSLSTRWTSSGGDSARRFVSAVESLDAWCTALRVWSFDLCDVFQFLDRVKDQEGHGLYLDPPWPGAGAEYLHRFTDDDHRRLAERLSAFKCVRVVVRYGCHPLIRELYSARSWNWVERETRNQRNNEVAEALIVNGEPVP